VRCGCAYTVESFTLLKIALRRFSTQRVVDIQQPEVSPLLPSSTQIIGWL